MKINHLVKKYEYFIGYACIRKYFYNFLINIDDIESIFESMTINQQKSNE